MSSPADVPPIVHLLGVVARDAAGPKSAPRGSLNGLTAVLGPGVHAFLGAPEDGTIALCEVLAGARSPLRGRVLVHGEEPHRSAAARARIGALLAAPDIPEARTTKASVALALGALGRPASEAEGVLAELGLAPLGARPVIGLSFAETRAVEMALAVAVAKHAPPPAVVALFEPGADLALPAGARAAFDVIGALRDAGACVVVATSSPVDARRIADSLWVLHRGTIARRDIGDAKALVLGDTEIAVWVPAGDSAALRALAAALAASPAVRAAMWDDPRDAGRPPLLRVRGPDRDACALAVVDAAASAGVALEAITSAAPDLGAVQSASLAWLSRVRAAARPPSAPRPRAPVEVPAAPPEPERGGQE